MPRLLATLLLAACVFAKPALAKSPRPSDQFYVNSDGEHAWNVDAKKNLRSTLWFVKNPPDAPNYQQLTAIVYDSQPSKVIYIDKAAKRVVGQLDLGTQQFSLLAAEAQKVRQPFDTIDFPPGGPLPSIEQMFEPLPDGQRGNTKKLALPPPTRQFPQLEQSRWGTCYMAANRSLIRAHLTLDGEQGTYQLSDKPGLGRLSNVKYEPGSDGHTIRGNWRLGNSNGYFRFTVPADNLNVFWGEFGFELGRTVGAWHGVRNVSNALKPGEKPLR